MSRQEAIEEYILLRLRTEDIKRLGFLVEGLYDGKVRLPDDSPFSRADLKDTVRTAYYGWLATLTDDDDRAVYAFDSLFALFPERRARIIKVQVGCEVCHPVLQQFRNTVAFHNRADVTAHIKARRALIAEDASMELAFAKKDFLQLMQELTAEELERVPELPNVITSMGLSHHPAFANVFPKPGVPF